jgi:TonB family protein
MEACFGGWPSTVSLLLEAGAAVRATDDAGMSPLHFAAERDAAGIALTLLEAGADAALCTLADATPLDIALANGSMETVRLLVARGACIGLGADYSAALMEAALDAPLRVVREPIAAEPRDFSMDLPARDVRVRFVVDAHGRALFPKALDAGEPFLGTAAEAAILGAKFEPPRLGGEPVAAVAERVVTFPASRDRIFADTEVDTPPRALGPAVVSQDLRSPRKGELQRVVLEYVVNAFGRPERIAVVESANPEYTEAAMAALAKVRFYPGMIADQPAAVRMRRTFEFPSEE